MSSFLLPGPDTAVPVTLPSNLTKDQLLEFPAFTVGCLILLPKMLYLHLIEMDGCSTKEYESPISNKDHEFHAAPYSLKNINVQAVDWFGGGTRLGFVKLNAEISNKDGESLPGSVFLRGPSVAMMVLLQPDDVPSGSQEEKHVILTLQPRIAAGCLAFAEAASRHGRRQWDLRWRSGKGNQRRDWYAPAPDQRNNPNFPGLEIPESELVNLSELAIAAENSQGEQVPQAMFPSAGGCDEFIPVFLHEKRVPREQLKEWTGKLTGLRDHGEKITLKLVRLEELWKEGARDSKALGAWGFVPGTERGREDMTG